MQKAALSAPWDTPAAPPIFDAFLTPNDSSTPGGRKALAFFLAAYLAVMALLWAALSAWPALLHGGLVAGFLLWAQRAERRRRAKWERVVVWRDKTRLLKGEGGRLLESAEWPTPWLRAVYAPGGANVALSCSDRRASLGGFLAPDDRRSFAAALTAALAAARRPA